MNGTENSKEVLNTLSFSAPMKEDIKLIAKPKTQANGFKFVGFF
jgi:hypothetical protein